MGEWMHVPTKNGVKRVLKEEPKAAKPAAKVQPKKLKKKTNK